jgi:hypothetical protein
MRRIADAGFEHSATRRLCSDAGWQLVADEPALGFIQYYLQFGAGHDDQRLLSVGIPQGSSAPYLFLPLFYFPEEEGEDPEEHDRKPFDTAYRRLSEELSKLLGQSQREGTYVFPHRSDWPYGFCVWQVPEAQVILLQDEHDIQFGLDVSLWMFPTEPDMPVPLPY